LTFKKGETPQGAKPFPKGGSGNKKGRPKGSISIDTRVRNLLEGKTKLPAAIAQTIRKAVGADRQALDATIIVGLLQALQGDDKWAKLLWERGYGRVPDKLEGGDPDKPIQHVFTLKIDNG
jgi:hypothetical protein